MLLLSLFFLSFFLRPSQSILEPTSATLAINQATRTICGITAGSHKIQCTTLHPAGFNESYPVDPTLFFEGISGGMNFICGLSGGASFFCWNGVNTVKRIYSGPMVLTEISVGARHVAAIVGNQTNIQTIRWWRHGCQSASRPCRQFPKSIAGEFHSLTSGDVFTCAISETHKVHCWGPHGRSIMLRFGGVKMRSVTAGGSRMCGLSLAGYVICSGGQLNVPSGEAFEFTSLAVGSSHTCTIRRHIGTVVCWGLYGSYSPAGATSFEFIIAGGDLTCGLTTASLTVACWGLNGTSLPALTISLPKVLPGVCVPDKRICSCGIYPDSETLCGGSGVICQRLDTSGTETCPLFAFKVKRPPAPPLTTLQKPSKWWFLYAVVGAVFAAAGVGFPLYFMCLRLARRGEKVMNSMLETAGGLLGIRHLEVFRFNDLKTATENFCTTCQQIAHYCVVYRGHLSDGRQVAVKRFQTQPDTLILYIKEVLILSVVRHPNLVKLIGYCKRKEEVFGVFEWMENETLHAHLHREPMNPQSVPFFTWKTRVRALLDVARGIEYLHGFPSPIIHRNISTSTILIDQSWVAKISEFGHALFASRSDKINEEIDVLKLAVGCVNPLATQEQCVTPKTDVYAFGVVMLEVLTGREELENGFCLADLIVTRGNLLDSLDERIAEPMGHELKALQRIMQLAQECVRRVALLRPTMNCIVSELERAVALFD